MSLNLPSFTRTAVIAAGLGIAVLAGPTPPVLQIMLAGGAASSGQHAAQVHTQAMAFPTRQRRYHCPPGWSVPYYVCPRY